MRRWVFVTAAGVSFLVLTCAARAANAPASRPAAASPSAASAPANPNQLPCLTDTPKQPRFKITDRLWPAKAGEADVCLWADDKLAAFCFGVDDNWQSDHAWWLEQQKKYGFPCTWFVITGRVGTGGFWGTWDDWKKLLAAGNDVQSHTVTHLNVEEAGYKGVEWDYSEAIQQIEKNLPGHKVKVLAYPGGKNSSHNSRELAAKYYLAARGTVGTPNACDRTDYLNVNATRLNVGEPNTGPWANVSQLLDPKNRNYFRGWGFYFTHGVEKESCLRVMEYIKQHEADFWVGLFIQEAQYGQERDTAHLEITAGPAAGAKADGPGAVASRVGEAATSSGAGASGAEAAIKFVLSDRMDDTRFDYALTVKVRLPEGWKAASAKQGGKDIECKVVEHGGASFALVKAVPDRGEVEVVRSEK